MSGPISSVGPYKVERELGRGGMGVVYLGVDSRLDRQVAIKALPEALAGDSERMARLEREAKILAALNHTNIAGIYGYEEKDGAFYLVMEFVEGPTLAERLAEGPMGVRESLELAAQIAAGIAAAHDAGVVHRDLKPGNIKIAPENRVKILDFGLAKMAATEGNSGPSLSQSPTKAYAETRDGIVLGTAGYMSPEQARGKVVDRRTDLWALGCILYEMLTGRQAFRGETISDTLAAVLRGEPEWGILPTETPAAVRRLLRRCLEKDARKRIRDASDARIEIEEALNEAPGTPVSGATAAAMARGVRPVPAFLFGAGLLVLGAVAGTWMKGQYASSPPGKIQPVSRVLIELPEEALGRTQLSPDGRTVAYIGSLKKGEGKAKFQLFRRPLNAFQVEPMPGTEGARGFSFSPDGSWIFFVVVVEGKSRLYRIPADASAPPVQVDEWSEEVGSGTNLSSGDLIFNYPAKNALLRMPVGNPAGRKTIPLQMGKLRGHIDSLSPLPGDDAVLAVVIYYGESGFVSGIATVELTSGKVDLVVEDGGFVKYHKTGHLVFTRGETLLAVPFDPKSRKVLGTPVALETGLRTENTWAPAWFCLSQQGTLLYAPGGKTGGNRKVALLSEGGKSVPWSEAAGSYIGSVALAPDQRSLAVVVTNADGIDEVWLSTPSRPALWRFAAVPNTDLDDPLWTPDGKALVYLRTAKDEKDGIYLHPLDGTPTRLLAGGTSTKEPLGWGWTPLGDLIVQRYRGAVGDVQVLPKGAAPLAASLRPLFPSRPEIADPMFSPDGKWLAYTLVEGGYPEIFLARYRQGEPPLEPVSVSQGAGTFPLWSLDGKALYYLTGWKVMTVSLNPDGRPSGAPRLFGDLSPLSVPNPVWGLRPGPEGKLLFVQRGPEEDVKPVAALVLNWEEELLEKSPARKS